MSSGSTEDLSPGARQVVDRQGLDALIAALAAVAVLGTVWLTHKASSKASQEELVRETIQEFDTAVQKGDLPKLRGITCGTTRDDYVHYPDKDWATTYPRIAAAKQYPVVSSIDQVVMRSCRLMSANLPHSGSVARSALTSRDR